MTQVISFFIILLGMPAALILCTLVARRADAKGHDGRIYGAAAFFGLFFVFGVALLIASA